MAAPTVESLQRQLQEEGKLRAEIAKKAQTLLQSKKQLKDEYAQAVSERNALQLQLSASDKVDIVKQLQERVAILERGRVDDSAAIDTSDPDALAKKVQQLTTQTELLRSQLSEARQIGDKPGLLIGKPASSEVHYIISMKDAEDMTKRIKKLQSELWNLEIKHQQLQEVHSRCGLVPQSLDLSSEEMSRLKDSIKKERDVNMLLQARYKDLNDAVLALKDNVTEKLAKDPDDRLLQTVLAVTKKAIPAAAPAPAPASQPSNDGRNSRGSRQGDETPPVSPKKEEKPAEPTLTSTPSRTSGKDPLKAKEREKKDERKSRVKVSGNQ